jgi:hypothetical protein
MKNLDRTAPRRTAPGALTQSTETTAPARRTLRGGAVRSGGEAKKNTPTTPTTLARSTHHEARP